MNAAYHFQFFVHKCTILGLFSAGFVSMCSIIIMCVYVICNLRDGGLSHSQMFSNSLWTTPLYMVFLCAMELGLLFLFCLIIMVATNRESPTKPTKFGCVCVCVCVCVCAHLPAPPTLHDAHEIDTFVCFGNVGGKVISSIVIID